jgi:hypothetical protein
MDHVLLLDRMLYEHVIVGPLKGGLDLDAFGPAIHLPSPRITFDLPWFQLRDRSRKLSPEHVVFPQWTVVIDIMILDEASRSTAQIFPLQINGSDLPFLNRRLRPAS